MQVVKMKFFNKLARLILRDAVKSSVGLLGKCSELSYWLPNIKISEKLSAKQIGRQNMFS